MHPERLHPEGGRPFARAGAFAVAHGRAFLTSLDLVENINKIKSKKAKAMGASSSPFPFVFVPIAHN
jgi:hypothetical protein